MALLRFCKAIRPAAGFEWTKKRSKYIHESGLSRWIKASLLNFDVFLFLLEATYICFVVIWGLMVDLVDLLDLKQGNFFTFTANIIKNFLHMSEKF